MTPRRARADSSSGEASYRQQSSKGGPPTARPSTWWHPPLDPAPLARSLVISCRDTGARARVDSKSACPRKEPSLSLNEQAHPRGTISSGYLGRSIKAKHINTKDHLRFAHQTLEDQVLELCPDRMAQLSTRRAQDLENVGISLGCLVLVLWCLFPLSAF